MSGASKANTVTDFFFRVFNGYRHYLTTKPYRTKALTMGAIKNGSDLVC